MRERKYCVDEHLYVHALSPMAAAQRKVYLILEHLAKLQRYPTEGSHCVIKVVDLETGEKSQYKLMLKIESNLEKIS